MSYYTNFLVEYSVHMLCYYFDFEIIYASCYKYMLSQHYV